MPDNIPTFKIGAHYYSGTQIVDKTLYARKTVTVLRGSVSIPVAKGMQVGKVYSWANMSGNLYFILYTAYTTSYDFVLYDAYSFSESAIEAQGGLTIEEEAAAKAEAESNANKSAIDKLIDSLGLSSIGTALKWGITVFVFGYIGIKLYGEKNKADSYKKIDTHGQ